LIILVTHYDADGYAAQQVLYHAFRASGREPRELVRCVAVFGKFGFEPSSTVCLGHGDRVFSLGNPPFNPGDVEEVYVTDLGGSYADVENLAAVFRDKPVRIIDHHASEIAMDVNKFYDYIAEKGYDITLIHDYTACSAALAYDYAKRNILGCNDPVCFSERLTHLRYPEKLFAIVAMGMSGDGYWESPGGFAAQVKAELLNVFSPEIVHVDRGSNSYVYDEHTILQGMVNAVRRIMWSRSPGPELYPLLFLDRYLDMAYLTSLATSEYEELIALSDPVIWTVTSIYKKWLDVRQSYDRFIVVPFRTMGSLNYAVINSLYEIGSWLSSVRSSRLASMYRREISKLNIYSKSSLGLVAELHAGVTIVFNERLGVVSIRGLVPFTNLSDFAAKYFNGGGHVIGAAAGSYQGSAEDFVRYLREKVWPEIRDYFARAHGDINEYIAWRRRLGEELGSQQGEE